MGRAANLLRQQRIDILVCNTPLVQAFADACGEALDIVGVGGVSIGQEAQVALTRGAKAVQIGSALMKEGPGVFARLRRELEAARTTQRPGI